MNAIRRDGWGQKIALLLKGVHLEEKKIIVYKSFEYERSE